MLKAKMVGILACVCVCYNRASYILVHCWSVNTLLVVISPNYYVRFGV